MLVQQLTQEEIEFCECFVDPICMTECCFSDLDNLLVFDEKIGEVRLGQFPMFSYEYMIDTEQQALSKKDNFKLKEGAGTIYCFGGRRFGKCEEENNKCLLADGTYVPFKELVGKSAEVVSLNQKTLKLENAYATFSDNGERDCIEVVLNSGKSITVTENHPLLTDRGWIDSKDLTTEDFIATPKKNKSPTLDKCFRYRKDLNSETLNLLLNSDIYWDNIISIKRVGQKRTVAVCVKGNENYISNDIISHNTHCVETLDICMSFWHLDGEHVGFSSIDALHIRGVVEKIVTILRTHKLFKILDAQINRSPNYRISLPSGYLFESINMNLSGQTPGNCFDKYTEVLTDSGWKFFKDLSYIDKVMSLDLNSGYANYERIDNIIVQKFSGNLKKLNSRTSEFVMTENHRLLLQDQNNKRLFFKEVGDPSLTQQFYCPATFMWKGATPKTIHFEGVVNSTLKTLDIDIIPWVKFVAWYVSEGTLTKKDSHYRIRFSQKNNCKELEDVLNSLGINYLKQYIKKADIYVYTVSNKLIYEYLEINFGKKKDKHLPKDFKNLDSSLLKIFIEEYLLGDGHSSSDGNYPWNAIFTSVKNLSDDLQEVASKAGYKTHLKTKVMNTSINGYTYTNYPMYFIQLLESKTSCFKKKLIEDVPYDDFVYCVETNPHNNVYIRRNGCVMFSSNSFFQKHLHRLYIEEAGFESEEVYNKRIDAVSEDGCVLRVAGMTNFTNYSPAGKAFRSSENRNKICNLPQTINPKWDSEEQAKAIREYGGEQSVGYRVFVNGEIVEDGIAVMDMERVRKQYLKDKQLKQFEITKENFNSFKDLLVLEKPLNAEKIYIAADIGETAPTEIIIIYELNGNYYYIHNIVAYRLDDRQQFQLIKYIADIMEANLISLDTTDGTGRSIFRQLGEIYAKENLVSCSFTSKLPVDFDRDDKGRVIFEMGKPKMKEEHVSEWSVKRLKQLFYDGKLWVPYDHKLDIQLNSVIATVNANRTVYSVVCPEDHLFAAFRVFAIAEWYGKYINSSINKSKKIDKCGC
jgi:hypothetical protein